MRSLPLAARIYIGATVAIGALLEEFVELETLQVKLTQAGKTPVRAAELDGITDMVALGREVGLLSVYEGTDTEPIRFRVPDIYRMGLKMTRQGQL